MGTITSESSLRFDYHNLWYIYIATSFCNVQEDAVGDHVHDDNAGTMPVM